MRTDAPGVLVIYADDTAGSGLLFSPQRLIQEISNVRRDFAETITISTVFVAYPLPPATAQHLANSTQLPAWVPRRWAHSPRHRVAFPGPARLTPSWHLEPDGPAEPVVLYLPGGHGPVDDPGPPPIDPRPQRPPPHHPAPHPPPTPCPPHRRQPRHR